MRYSPNSIQHAPMRAPNPMRNPKKNQTLAPRTPRHPVVKASPRSWPLDTAFTLNRRKRTVSMLGEMNSAKTSVANREFFSTMRHFLMLIKMQKTRKKPHFCVSGIFSEVLTGAMSHCRIFVDSHTGEFPIGHTGEEISARSYRRKNIDGVTISTPCRNRVEPSTSRARAVSG